MKYRVLTYGGREEDERKGCEEGRARDLGGQTCLLDVREVMNVKGTWKSGSGERHLFGSNQEGRIQKARVPDQPTWGGATQWGPRRHARAPPTQPGKSERTSPCYLTL